MVTFLAVTLLTAGVLGVVHGTHEMHNQARRYYGMKDEDDKKEEKK